MTSENTNNSLAAGQQIDTICDDFEQAWKQGEQPSLEEYLERAAAELRPRLASELWAIECHYESIDTSEDTRQVLAKRYPKVAEMLADATLIASDVALADPTIRSGQHSESAGLHIRCPHCSNPVELLADVAVDEVSCNSCGSQFSLVDDSESFGTDRHSLKTMGRFELLSRLGVGGFGTVWKAHDTELDRIVALKIPRKGNLSAAEVEHFLREARAAAQLRHPNIVPVFEVGREENTVFIVSEFVQGESLSDWMKECRRPADEIARICASVTDALTEAHSAGIIHRDLKPSNIMLDLHGKPRLMDFGLAKREIGEVTMTLDGFVVGTPAYMSPEQARGEGHWTDQRTDVYSMGVMLFHLLTNELPFRGSPAMQIQSRLTSDPPHPRSLDPSVPRDLATVCLKCIELDPNRRYQTAKEVGDELRRYLDGKPVVARPLPARARAWRWIKRHPAISTALLLGTILAIVGPTAAVMIEGQRREIARRLSERNELVNQQNRERIALQKDLADLRDRFASVTGHPAEPMKNEPWRKDLINSLLDERYEQYSKQASNTNDPRESGDLHLALAELLTSVDRIDEAVAEYTSAWDKFSLLSDKDTAAERIRIALPLASHLLSKQETDKASDLLDQLHGLIEEESPITQIEYLQSRYDLTQDDTAKNKLFLDAGELNTKLMNNWPNEVSEVKSLRDQLLLQRPAK